MDPTTLVTFLYAAPRGVRIVELLGSWDNFKKSYRMHHDRRRGTGMFTGCFKFENITLDGDDLRCSRPRSGGLKQGGTYWYYYRLDYNYEDHDERQPRTTHCPLLPGQTVNILEVPVEVIELPSRCHSAHADIVGSPTAHTMDPYSKFGMLHPPPLSRFHNRCLSDDALRGRLDAPQIASEETVSPAGAVAMPRETDPNSPERHISTDDATGDDSLQDSTYFNPGYAYVPPPGTESWRPWSDTDADSEYMYECGYKPYYQDDYAGSRTTSLYRCESRDAALSSLSHADVVLPGLAETSDEGGCSHGVSSTVTASLERPTLDGSEVRPDAVDDRVAKAETSVKEHASFHGLGSLETAQGSQLRVQSRSDYDLGKIVTDEPPVLTTADSSPSLINDQDCISTPHNEAYGFDLTSPSFSAATLSTGGQNTPFRLSANYSHVPKLSRPDGDSVLHDVTDRLQYLNTGGPGVQDSADAPDPSDRGSNTSRATSQFLKYSLPLADTGSTQSLSKTLSHPSAPRTAIREIPPLPVFLHEEQVSMADAIFSELGYLGDSIA